MKIEQVDPLKKSPHDKLFETFVINLATLEKSTEGSRLTRFHLNPNSLKHNKISFNQQVTFTLTTYFC